jgi:UDP-N-acetylmuramate: L-alanyl-gamma-D-glutamyl-meso-diaminopimelate ligase
VDQKKKFHFIAIGSSATYHLAVALRQLGHTITTSDEQVPDDVRTKLVELNLLPQATGWHPESMDRTLDGVIIGVQANRSNPELIKAQQLGLKVYTVPEFIYEFARNKQRVVVVGTSGRTEIASMIVHVLKTLGRQVDYVLSGERHDTIHLSDSPLIVIDGSESRSSAVYHTPQFIRYKHHVGIMAEVEYDPTGALSENDFIRQFDLFADGTPKGGILIYWEQDKIASVISNKERADVVYVPYKAHPSTIEGAREFLVNHKKERVAVPFTGKKAFLHVNAAFEALKKLGVTSEQFYSAITSYNGLRDEA